LLTGVTCSGVKYLAVEIMKEGINENKIIKRINQNK
jgi:hypothetical protein